MGIIKEGGDVQIVAAEINKESDMHEIEKYRLFDKVLCHDTSSKVKILSGLTRSFWYALVNSRTRRNIFHLLKKVNMIKWYSMKSYVKALSSLYLIDPYSVNLAHSHSILKTYEYLFLKEAFGIPLITTFHGLPTKNISKLDNDKCKIVFEKGNLFFVNTLFAKKQIMKLGCAEEKVRILPQGTNINNFPKFNKSKIPERQLNVVSLCRLSYDKGLNYLIEAIDHLKSDYPYMKYRMIGSGPEEQELRKLIKEKKLEDHVTMCGRLSFQQVIDQFANSDIFVLPSIRAEDESFHEETQAVVIQEAQCMGIPVIATKVGGIPDCNIHRETAFLINDRDSLEIADAITKLKEDGELYKHLAVNGCRHVLHNFDAEIISKKMAHPTKAYLDSCRA